MPAWPDLPLPAASTPGLLQAATNINLFPHPSGVVKGLTILVDFSDQASAYSKDEIDAWLNQSGYSKFGLKGSVRDYYLNQSNGKVDYQNEVHGFYRAKQPKSYYQGGTAYERADELWAEVVAALDAEIDYSSFDNDKDGKTEAISLLYAGGEGTFGKGLWPHAGGSSEKRDGVRLNRYMMTALNNQPTNYVFSHESGHMLFGWPDLYGVGDYCVMANRGSDTNPVGINDMFRADQGWIDIIDIAQATNARYSAVPDGVVYRFLNPTRPTEYFLWSNVQNTAEWVSLKGGGLLVWHFDNSIRSNEPPAKLELAVVQATAGSRALGGTTWPSPGSAAGDLYSKATNAELAASTTPSSAWNNAAASGLRIYDISASGPTMQFSVGTGPLPPDNGSGGSGGGGTTGGQTSSGGVAGATGGKGSGGSAGKSSGGAAGASGGNAGSAGRAGGAGTAAGGNAAMGGSSGTSSGGIAGASAGTGGNLSTSGGSSNSTGGAGNNSGGVATSTGGIATSAGGAIANTGGANGNGGSNASGGVETSGADSGNLGTDTGCACRVGTSHDRSGSGLFALFATAAASVIRRRRRVGGSCSS
ncbi:MAG TPA: M6 family metalloprotease domain-containing protein [Polyangiaceae bacterium]|nr:M6 family metalloprotease domain-containing protein [Polyangiaceae bacterium]